MVRAGEEGAMSRPGSERTLSFQGLSQVFPEGWEDVGKAEG